MNIAFYVNEIDGGWSPTDKRLGGTEESIVQWANELTRRGHKVLVYANTTPDLYEVDGIKIRYDLKEDYINSNHDFVIVVKDNTFCPNIPSVYLTNEVDADRIDLSCYGGVILPSKWAVDNIPVNNRTFVVPHGYDDKKIYPSNKIKKQCLYASSPDRGLENIERIWPSIVENHPDAHLYVTYGGYINTPNTTCGEFSEEEMNNLFNTSEFWLHPASGGEMYCISGVKAQASGAIPIYFPTMALAETVKVGRSCNDIRGMYYALNSLLGDEDAKDLYRWELSSLKLPNWSDSTDSLESAIIQINGNTSRRFTTTK